VQDLDGYAGPPLAGDASVGSDGGAADGATSRDGGPAIDGDVDGDGSAGPCGFAGRGPDGVPVASAFCIDATEVTQSQYAAFVADRAGDTSGQRPACAWNTSFAPNPGCGYDPVARAEHPVGGVNWCSAAAFCAWAGKRLCGSRDAGAVAPEDATDPAKAAWMAACTNLDDGLHAYPYGNAYDPAACNGKDLARGGTAAVRSLAGCGGGHPGLNDMSGNVFEWIDACTADGGSSGQTDRCVAQGGSFLAGELLLRCSGVYQPERAAEDCQLGFRCCSL